MGASKAIPRYLAAVAAAVFAFTGCGGVASPPGDSGAPDSGGLDSGGETDAGDAGDAGNLDAGGADAGPLDAGPLDAGRTDGGGIDAGIDGGSDAGSPDAGRPDAGACTLRPSGPVTATANNQVIEYLDITSTSGPAIQVSGHRNVIIRNVRIHHAGGPGIDFANAPNLLIQDVDIVQTSAPASGPNPSPELNNIQGDSSSGVVVTRARLTRGSSGIYLVRSPGARLSFIEGHDFRGPLPRGQLVQFDSSSGSVLEDFSCENGSTSWTEDNVSVYRSSNVTVRRGLVDGNNSPSGVGVMFEMSDAVTDGGLAEDIDALHQGNGCLSGYPARNVIFRRVRARDNICTDQGRGLPSSHALVFAGSPDSVRLQLLQATVYALCDPNNVVWDPTVFTTIDVQTARFTPRPPVRLTFCFGP